MSPSRRVALVAALALPFGALTACSVDELSYTSQSIAQADGGSVPAAEGGPINVVDGGFEAVAPPAKQPFPSPMVNVACGGLDGDAGGCDPTAGLGCCLVASSDPSGNACDSQLQYFQGNGSICKGANDTFITCVASDDDNTCCWQRSASGINFHTRYRAACADGGTEACDPNGPGGGLCNGVPGDCKTIICGGVTLGFCSGGETPTCN